jgi:hypothetical protein
MFDRKFISITDIIEPVNNTCDNVYGLFLQLF